MDRVSFNRDVKSWLILQSKTLHDDTHLSDVFKTYLSRQYHVTIASKKTPELNIYTFDYVLILESETFAWLDSVLGPESRSEQKQQMLQKIASNAALKNKQIANDALKNKTLKAQTDTSESHDATSETKSDTSESQSDMLETQNATFETKTDASETKGNASESHDATFETKTDASETKADASKSHDSTSEAQNVTSETKADIVKAQNVTSETQTDAFETIKIPLVLIWLRHLHIRSWVKMQALCEDCDIILHSTRLYIASFKQLLPAKIHIWFPPFANVTASVEKKYKFVYAGAIRVFPRLISFLQEYLNLQYFACDGDIAKQIQSQSIVSFCHCESAEITFKMFEIVAGNSILCTNQLPELIELGFVDGTNCILFKDFKDCLHKVTQVLQNGTYFKMLDSALILAQQHTFEKRFEQLQKILDTQKFKKILNE